ncbi:MAG: RNA polymerase sigma factor [Alphaproteobacteria bacterium]|nr:RNA polymerase sigma factor [Alphaproteobacteria bacterium]
MTELDAELRARLAAAVRRVCPAWMRDEEDDLTQMALMRLLRAGVPEQLTGTYLSKVAYSAVIDEIRRKKRRQEVGMTPSVDERMADSKVLGPEQLARAGQIGQAVVEAVSELAPDRRRAVTLYLQGYPVPEIAEFLEWDRKKASNAVYRGLTDLREALKARGIDP